MQASSQFPEVCGDAREQRAEVGRVHKFLWGRLVREVEEMMLGDFEEAFDKLLVLKQSTSNKKTLVSEMTARCKYVSVSVSSRILMFSFFFSQMC